MSWDKYAKMTKNEEIVWIKKETVVVNLKLLFVLQVAEI
jgi:hypothetical protein